MINLDYLLTKIKVISEGLKFSEYDFSYGHDNINSYLTEVTLTNGVLNGEKLNSTRFTYGRRPSTQLEFQEQFLAINTNNQEIFHSGDFNGDGLTDIIGVVTTGALGNKKVKEFITHLKEPNEDKFKEMPAVAIIGNDASFVYRSNLGVADNVSFMGQDYNSDTYDDVPILKTGDVIIYEPEFDAATGQPVIDPNTGLQNQIPVTYSAVKAIEFHYSNGDGTLKPPVINPVNALNIVADPIYITGDFDGDTNADYLLIFSDGTRSEATINSPNNNIFNRPILVGTGASYYFASEFVNSQIKSTVDINGDGKSEIIVQDINIFTGAVSFTKIYSIRMGDNGEFYLDLYGTTGVGRIASFVDFNGDGKTDILQVTPAIQNNFLYFDYDIFLNTGRGEFKEGVFVSRQRPSAELHISDFDGNGFTDIVFSNVNNINSTTNYSMGHDFYFSRGNSFYYKNYNYIISASACIGTPPAPTINFWGVRTVGDFNGDGKADFLTRSCQNGFNLISFQKDATNHLLETIQDGFNREVSFTYEKATTGTFYTKTPYLQESDVINKVKLPMFLVKFMEQPVSLDLSSITPTNPTPTILTSITDYAYEDALVHRKGLGFLGFSKITEHNAHYNTTNTSINAIQKDERKQYISSYLYKTTSNSSGITTETTNENEIVNLGNRYWMRPRKTTSKNLYTGVTTVQEQVKYDDVLDAQGKVLSSKGNLLELKTTVNTDAEIQISKTTYGQRGSWITNAPLTTNITTTRKGEDPYTVESTRTFNATSGALESETALSNTTDFWVKTEFIGYNDFGQATTKKITGAGLAAARNSTMTYSGNGRFVTETANVLGQVEKLEDFDLRWGKPQQVTSIGGKIARAKYDGFGRLIESSSEDITSGTTHALNKVHKSTVTYAWADWPYLYTVTSVSPGNPTVKEYFDLFERSVKKEVTGFAGATVTTEVTYDGRGRVATSKSPHYSGGLFVTTTNTYDDQNRLTTVELSGITGSSSMQYIPNTSNGEFTVKATDAAGKVTKKVTDATGKTVKVIDDGGELQMTYYSHGGQRTVHLKSVPYSFPPLPSPVPTLVLLSTMLYDAAARQTSLVEPNSGTSTYKYNSLGELIEQNIAGAGLSKFKYNLLGQMLTSEEPSNTGTVTNTYEYYPTGSGTKTNALKTMTSSGFSNHKKEYIYDADGRIKDYTETVKGRPFTSNYAYDEYGRVKEYTYPTDNSASKFKIKKVYDGAGYLLKVTDEAGTLNIFNGTSMDALGHYKTYTLGNGITSTMTYDIYGLPEKFSSSVFDQSYEFDKKNGNLKWRKDNLKSLKEDFTYDVLERLTSATVTGQPVMTMEYADNGNISFKTGLTNYTYDPLKIHAVKRVENYPTDLNRGLQNVTYTKFHQADLITEKFKQSGQNWQEKIELEYGTDHERRYAKFSTTKATGGFASETYYLGNYEEKKDLNTGIIYKIHYISGGNGLCAMVVNKGQGNEYFYTYRDYLGSILTVTDAGGAKVAEQSFDAWGRRRSPTNWSYTLPSQALPDWLYRGYTGHEHYDRSSNIVLINMNARLYDPVNARFLRWDIVVADGAGTQGYNRYSYALNNPLKYTDPSGNFIIAPVVLAGLKGAAMGVFFNGLQNLQNGDNFFKGAGMVAVKGFIFGAMTFGIGSAAEGLKGASAFFFKAGMHGLVGGMQSMADGGSFKSGFAASAVSSMLGGATSKYTKGDPVLTILAGGLSGGVSAEIAGGNFWSGFKQGIMVSALNEVAHMAASEILEPPTTKYRSAYAYVGDPRKGEGAATDIVYQTFEGDQMSQKTHRAYIGSDGNFSGFEVWEQNYKLHTVTSEEFTTSYWAESGKAKITKFGTDYLSTFQAEIGMENFDAYVAPVKSSMRGDYTQYQTKTNANTWVGAAFVGAAGLYTGGAGWGMAGLAIGGYGSQAATPNYLQYANRFTLCPGFQILLHQK